ncbi:MAG: YihY/virulence factor BrkB family protein [Catenulispora sp.]
MPVRAIASRLDGWQQRHSWLAFPLAVWRKYSEDQAGTLAAALAFFAFLSLFPLMLILVTVLGLVLRDHPDVQRRVVDSALVDFPVIGEQIRSQLHGFDRTGFSLGFSVIGTLLGARGLAGAAQNALNKLWAVPFNRRPGFPASWLRSYGMIALMGAGVLATTALSGVSTWTHNDAIGTGLRVGTLAASLAVNVCLFSLGIRLAVAKEITWRRLRFGALLAALLWQGLQLLGGYIVAHQLRHASALYGTFGLVLGLIAWLYLQATLTLYAVEIDVVRARKLWPRSLFPPPLTHADNQAHRAYQATEERAPNGVHTGGSG